MRRKIVHIDEEKCDGCGLCVPSCAEGAIQIVDGKARLVSEVYCDGLGACLGHCPQDAIRLEEREAKDFDEQAAHAHAKRLQSGGEGSCPTQACPGSSVQSLLNVLPASEQPGPPPHRLSAAKDGETGPAESGLRNWPVQLHLVPPRAAFLRDADLLLVADCVPVACAEFHRRFLRGNPVVIGCPKLDDGRAYVEKLAAIIAEAAIRSVKVVHMEVPCCSGVTSVVNQAIHLSEQKIPVEEITITINGNVK